MAHTKLSIGIVGLPNVGKSTLFNALTRQKVNTANYPFCTIDPSVGVVAVPDERLARLGNLSKSERIIPAAIEFVDIAGLVAGAAQGEGLGNQFLAHIRETHAIAHVVRIFDDTEIAHVAGSVDPLRDIEMITLELVLADAETVEKRRASIERECARREKEALRLRTLFEKIAVTLDRGRPASETPLSDDERKMMATLSLLTVKPVLFVLNRRAGSANLDEIADTRWSLLMKYFSETGAQWVSVDAGLESELMDLSSDEKREFRTGLGALDDGVKNVIRAGYDLLGLITFFTTGPDETRAWTIRRCATAPEAGAAIHSDFRDKFIRAEVIHEKKLISAGSYAVARERGLLRTEGREYVVKDGDVIEFRI